VPKVEAVIVGRERDEVREPMVEEQMRHQGCVVVAVVVGAGGGWWQRMAVVLLLFLVSALVPTY